jgi:hypothetical protein
MLGGFKFWVKKERGLAPLDPPPKKIENLVDPDKTG